MYKKIAHLRKYLKNANFGNFVVLNWDLKENKLRWHRKYIFWDDIIQNATLGIFWLIILSCLIYNLVSFHARIRWFIRRLCDILYPYFLGT